MNKLLNEINTYQNSDIDYDLFDKLQGEIELGAKVEIFWEDREETDKGYIFALPHQDFDEYDVCIQQLMMTVMNPTYFSGGSMSKMFKHWKESGMTHLI